MFTPGSRATATYRFGYVALDLLHVTQSDIGVYTCKVWNILGEDQVSANLNVKGLYQLVFILIEFYIKNMVLVSNKDMVD